MSLSFIVAMSRNRVIGKDNDIPWHISADLKRFKKITMGHPIIMGRKTFESIGKALPGRKNIVISRQSHLNYKNITHCLSIEDAIELVKNEEESFIIGGAEIYKAALSLTHKIYLTIIDHDIEGDRYFPKIDLENDFKILEKSEVFKDEKSGLSYYFLDLQRFPSKN